MDYYFTPREYYRETTEKNVKVTKSDAHVFISSNDDDNSYVVKWFKSSKQVSAMRLSFDQRALETFHQVWPSLRGSFHLTSLRLFAPVILIGTMLYLFVVISREHHESTHHDDDDDNVIATFSHPGGVSYIALSTMILIMTDDECYVQEYGRFKLWCVACFVLAGICGVTLMSLVHASNNSCFRNILSHCNHIVTTLSCLHSILSTWLACTRVRRIQ